MTLEPAALPPPRRRTHVIAAGIAVLIIPINTVVYFAAVLSPSSIDPGLVVFSLLALAQLVAGVTAIVATVRHRRDSGRGGVVAAVAGGLAAVGAPAGWLAGMGLLALGSAGGAWGRPLRIRGRQLHPQLTGGADWTAGDRPDPSGLDAATRAALEALWLHDAQKEHASVPAFARCSWLLAAVGAPAELLAWTHRAAIEEIDHTRRCFALAAGYAGRSFTVEAMPELLLGGLDAHADPLVLLAVESLCDGCQLEDYNADVAAACARVCTEPATRAVLDRIAAEERSHAELSWAILTWTLERDRARVQASVEQALLALEAYPRPTAVSADKAELVARADAGALRAHGRLLDVEWAAAWEARLIETRRRARALLDGAAASTAQGTRADRAA